MTKQKPPWKYEVHFRRHLHSITDYSLVGRCNTLWEASRLRTVSGDLVVFSDTHKTVPSYKWMFEWEVNAAKNDQYCYAHSAILHDNGNDVEIEE